MLIKSADDQTRRLQLLEALQASPRLDRGQKEKLEKYLQRTKSGLKGERDAAHYIDTHLLDSENHAVLHDLRFEIDGSVAQIDHLIIGRLFFFYLLETKNFGGNLVINDHGEFTVEYGREKYGIESPIEQSKRHEAMLVRLLDELGISGRFSKRPTVFHAVLLHPRAIIERPAKEKFDTSIVMKADQFNTWRLQQVDAMGVGSVFRHGVNVVASETLAEWGRNIAARHVPPNPLELPAWLAPQAPKPRLVKSAAVVRESSPPPYVSTVTTASRAAPPAATAEARKLICSTCGAKISYPEGKFCWNNEKRFGGSQYCREHQKAF